MELEDFTFFDDATVEIPLPDFRYFPLHDLESLWWIGAHFVVARAVTHRDPNELDRTYYSKHAQFAAQVFGTKAPRTTVMTAGLYFYTRLHLLHPAVRAAGDLLHDCRKKLVQAHRAAENDLRNMDFHSADGAHEMIRDSFATIAEMFKDADFYMEPIPLK